MIATLAARIVPMLLAAAAAMPLAAQTTTPADLLAGYVKQAGAPASPERGQKFFTTNFGKTMGFSCASCHGANPTGVGKDQVTDKPIRPLAPATNFSRFTDKTRADNAFLLNCRDVLERPCTAAEKADVLSWLISLKP